MHRNPTQSEIIRGLAQQVLDLNLTRIACVEQAISLGAQIEAHAGLHKAEQEALLEAEAVDAAKPAVVSLARVAWACLFDAEVCAVVMS